MLNFMDTFGNLFLRNVVEICDKIQATFKLFPMGFDGLFGKSCEFDFVEGFINLVLIKQRYLHVIILNEKF